MLRSTFYCPSARRSHNLPLPLSLSASPLLLSPSRSAIHLPSIFFPSTSPVLPLRCETGPNPSIRNLPVVRFFFLLVLSGGVRRFRSAWCGLQPAAFDFFFRIPPRFRGCGDPEPDLFHSRPREREEKKKKKPVQICWDVTSKSFTRNSQTEEPQDRGAGEKEGCPDAGRRGGW